MTNNDPLPNPAPDTDAYKRVAALFARVSATR